MSGKVGGSINRVSAILLACARLHNFIIRRDHPFDAEVTYDSIDDKMDALGICPNRDAPLCMSYLPVIPNKEFEAHPGILRTREAIVEYICENDIRRSLHNIARQRSEQQLQSIDISPSGCVNDQEFISPN